MNAQDITVTFLGAGAMGGAMIQGILHNELLKPEQIVAADPNAERGQELAAKHGIRYLDDNVEAVQDADIVVLAVKPQVLDRVMAPLRGRVDSVSLIVSIVAGAKIRTIAGDLQNSRIVRAMPNTPAQISEGITVWTATHEVMEEQRQQARMLLSAIGEQIYTDDEKYLDMATAIGGSGPGYVFLIIEALIDAGVHLGFSRAHAEKIAVQTVKGAAEYMKQSGQHPAILRNQVTSPGGTTAAGLAELERYGVRRAIAEAVWASYHRSVELGEGDD